jgi:hypothetical protein
VKNRMIWIPSLIVLGLLAIQLGLSPAYATGDFTITANPSSFGEPIAGGKFFSTINVTSTGGFSGTVSLSATAPSGVTTTFNPTSVTVSSGGSATSTLKIAFDIDCNIGPGHTVTVTGQSGTLSHNVQITYQLPIRC